MKKIMFNDRYGLTEAVLERRKAMMRRNVKWDMLCDMREDSIGRVRLANELTDGRQVYFAWDAAGNPIGQAISTYHVGEEVAVAQSYESIIDGIPEGELLMWKFLMEKGMVNKDGWIKDVIVASEGYRNKLFVKADLMPHRIRITDIKLERLQDISDEDCLAEGIFSTELDRHIPGHGKTAFEFKCPNGKRTIYPTPRHAFAALIDKVSGNGTWERNPWVFVYEFELIK